MELFKEKVEVLLQRKEYINTLLGEFVLLK
jgi:hypothetical protein